MSFVYWIGVRIMVFHATFNNISVISRWSILLVAVTRENHTCRQWMTNITTQSCIEFTSTWAGFHLTIFVVVDTDCTSKFKYNHDHNDPYSEYVCTRILQWQFLHKHTLYYGTVRMMLRVRCYALHHGGIKLLLMRWWLNSMLYELGFYITNSQAQTDLSIN